MTFEEHYCAAHHCDAQTFRRRLFRQTVPPSVRPIAALLRLTRPQYFLPDDAFIHGVGEAQTIDEVRQEAQGYHTFNHHEGWLRRVVRVRVSGRRMVRLASAYLPDGRRS